MSEAERCKVLRMIHQQASGLCASSFTPGSGTVDQRTTFEYLVPIPRRSAPQVMAIGFDNLYLHQIARL